MQEARPKSKLEKLYRFLYLSHFAYGALRGRSYNAADEGVAARTIARIENTAIGFAASRSALRTTPTS
jgi:DNA adenine methylase